METTTTTTKTKYFSRPGLSLYFQFFNLSKGITGYEITLNSLFHCHEYRPKKANAKNVCMNYNENKYVIGNKVT